MKTASGSRFAGVLLAAFALTAGGCSPAAVPTPSPGLRTAVEACHLPANADKGGQTLAFNWNAWVEEDQSDAGVVFAVSGLNDVICEVSRNPDGTFGSTTLALGGLGPADVSELTYDAGITAALAAPRIVVAGRAPAGTAQVEVASRDVRGTAALSDGLYVARLQTSQPVTEVAAMGVDGVVLARLTDPNGLVAGAASSSAGAGTSPAPSTSPALTPTPSGLSPVPGPWGGLRWSVPVALPDGTSFGAVTSFNGELFAVGRVPAADGQDELAFWHSSDGSTWTPLAQGGAALADAPMFPNLLATPNGLLAWGFVSPGTCPVPSGGPCGPVFLTSSDGVTWTRVADDPTFAGASIQALASGPYGLVAVGDTGWDNPAIWVSDTGATWQRLTLPTAVFADGHFSTVRATSTGYVLAGGTGSMSVSVTGGPASTVSKVAAGWWSADGRTWAKASVTRAAETGSSLGTISVGADGLVATGVRADGRDYAAWTSPDGRIWTPIVAGSFGAPAASPGVPTLPSFTLADDGTHVVAVGEGDQRTLRMWSSSNRVTWQPLPFSGETDSLPLWPGDPTRPWFDRAFVVPDGLVVIGHWNSSLVESVWHAAALP